MKHIFGPKFSCDQSLAQCIIEHFIDFRPTSLKPPNIWIGTGKRTLFFSKRSIPQTRHVHALPLEPAIALLLRCLPRLKKA